MPDWDTLIKRLREQRELTATEKLVALLALHGGTRREIATDAGLSPGCVGRTMRKLVEKGVVRRAAFVIDDHILGSTITISDPGSQKVIVDHILESVEAPSLVTRSDLRSEICDFKRRDLRSEIFELEKISVALRSPSEIAESSSATQASSKPVPRVRSTNHPSKGIPTRPSVVSVPGRAMSRAPGKALLHPDWRPTEATQAYAREKGLDPEEELKRMRNWAEGKGIRMADWNARFRSWCDRSADMRKTRRAEYSNGVIKQSLPTFAEIQRERERQSH